MSFSFYPGDMVERFLDEDAEAKEVALATPGKVIKDTLMVYGGVYLVAMLLFCHLRKKYPRLYNVRSWAENYKCDLATEQYGFISWMWNLYAVSEDDLLDQCGMDALCFLRVLEFGFKVAIMGILNSIWLMPVYGTAPSSIETAPLQDRIVKVTAGNIPSGNARLIAIPIASWILFSYVIYLVLLEFEWFTQKRHEFLAKTMPRNYAVYVSGIHDDYRSSAALLDFFRKAYGYDAVLEAHIGMDIPNLEAKVAQRESVVGKLEHAINIEEVQGITPMHKSSMTVTEKINSIETYSEELRELNAEVTEAISKIQVMNDPGTYKEDLEHAETQSLIAMSAIRMQPNDNTDQSMVSILTGVDESVDVQQQSRTQNLIDGSEKTGTTVRKGLASTMKGMVFKEDGGRRESGFVVFKKLTTVAAAQQMIHHKTPFVMECAEAPNPDDIFWANVGKTHKKIQIGKLLGLLCTIMLCLFWTIPVGFVASISNIEGLKGQLPFIATVIEKSPWVEDVLAVLAPQFLVILNALLPIILLKFVQLEGPISSSVMESSLFVKLAAFMIIQTFFVASLAGALFEKLSEIANNPSEIINLLATTLPSQSTFYMQILLIRTFIGLSIELLRVAPLAIAYLRSKVGPNLTEKERNATYLGLRPLAELREFEYAEVLADAILYFMVTFVYSTLAPVTNYFLAFCYLQLGAGYRHQFIHNYPTTPDSGGRLWMGFIGIAMTCVLIAQITLVGFLLLKKSFYGQAMMYPLIAIQILFSYYLRQEHFHVTEHLPSGEAIEQDMLNNTEGPMDYSFVKDQFLQPALQSKEIQAENFGIDREIAQESKKYMTPPHSEAEVVDDTFFEKDSFSQVTS